MITLNKYAISAKIKERYAYIVYSFDFESMKQNGSKELKFEITIDPQAFISSFEANIDGQIFHGITKEKETAAKEYSAAKQKHENAILISKPYDNIPNVFQIKTNIDAKSNILLNITIEQYLQKRFNFNQLNIQILRDFSKYYIKKHYQFISFTLEISDKSGIYDIHVPEDLITIHHKTMDETNQNYVINGDINESAINEFILKYKIKGEQNDSYILYDNKTNTFCHIISDIITDSIMNEDIVREGDNNDIIRSNNILIPRRALFVIDKSGSMRGIKWNNTISATVVALKELRNGCDRYCLMFFSNCVEIYGDEKGFVLTDDTNTSDAILYLENQGAQGGTNINDALLKAIELIKHDIDSAAVVNNLFLNQIIFITDGEANSGETNTKQIIRNVQNVNNLADIDAYYSKISICSFGVGRDGNDSLWTKDLNHSFLKLLSVNNNGFYKRIKQTTADTVLNEYFNILSKPILSNINIKYNNKNIDNLTKTSFNTLYCGNDLIICGKINNIKENEQYDIDVTISAITGKQMKQSDESNIMLIKPINICKQIQINVSGADNNQNMDRIWAYLKLQQLADNKLKYNDMIEFDDDEKKNEDALPLSLAMKYKFVTPWTSMIVVKKKKEETDDEKKQMSDDNDAMKQPKEQPSCVNRVWGYTLNTNNVQGFKQRQTQIRSIDYSSSESKQSSNTNNAERDFYKTFLIESGKIGEGAFARVRTITRKSDKKKFDLKMVKKKGKSIDDLSAIKLEIDVLKKCNHPNIVDLESSVDTRKRIYIVIEMCNGGNIIERIVQSKRWSEPLTINAIKQIASGLHHLHSLGFVHNDLKPDNLLYVNKDSDSLIKICEFAFVGDCSNGLCQDIVNGVAGYYSAPEIICLLPYDESADMWSLGVIVYILLCGFPPFFDETYNIQNLSELIKKGQYSFSSPFWDKISKNAKDLIAKLLVKDSKKRLSAKQVLNHEWMKNENQNVKYHHETFGIEYMNKISNI